MESWRVAQRAPVLLSDVTAVFTEVVKWSEERAALSLRAFFSFHPPPWDLVSEEILLGCPVADYNWLQFYRLQAHSKIFENAGEKLLVHASKVIFEHTVFVMKTHEEVTSSAQQPRKQPGYAILHYLCFLPFLCVEITWKMRLRWDSWQQEAALINRFSPPPLPLLQLSAHLRLLRIWKCFSS